MKDVPGTQPETRSNDHGAAHPEEGQAQIEIEEPTSERSAKSKGRHAFPIYDPAGRVP